ncbi:MAG: NAD(P)/FAD-dependent oxidoreductase [bacterium]
MMNEVFHSVPNSTQITIIGGGPAGSAAAILLARQGYDVVLLEKDRFPRHKLCGEFLSLEAQGLLTELAALESIRARGSAGIHQARFTAASGREIHFALPGECLGISRYRFDEILFRRAQEEGVLALEGIEVCGCESLPESGWHRLRIRSMRDRSAQQWIETKYCIGAFGRRSRMDWILQRDFLQDHHPYVGFKKHLRCRDDERGRECAAGMADTVEIHTFAGGYCGMCFVEEELVNCCMLLEKRVLTGRSLTHWENLSLFLSEQNPVLCERLNNLLPDESPLLSVAQVPFVRKEQARDGVLFIGDAAGMISPLCGDGQAMALQSAFLLADLFAQNPALEQSTLARLWGQRWTREFGRRLRLGKVIQTVLFRPGLSHLFARVTEFVPQLPVWLAKQTRG